MDRSNSIKTTELRYTQVGEYYFPDIRLKGNVRPIRRWGRMKRDYLRAHREMLYSDLVLSEKLYPHLLEIQQSAENRMAQMMQALQKTQPAPDKKSDQMGWVQHMNSLRAQAEEIVTAELITS